MSHTIRRPACRWSLVFTALVVWLALAVSVVPLYAGGAVGKAEIKGVVVLDEGAHLNVRRFPTGYAEVIYQLDAKAEVTIESVVVTGLTVNTPPPPTPRGGAAAAAPGAGGQAAVQTGGYSVILNSPACGGNPCIILPGIGSTALPPLAGGSGPGVGVLDRVDSATCTVEGWAVDGANPTAVVQVQIDGLAAGNFLTVLNRPDVTTQTGVPGSHGFAADLGLLLPTILDGKNHQVSVVILGAAGSQTALGGTPQTIACPAQSAAAPTIDRVWLLVHYVPSGAGADSANCGEVVGWVNARYVKVYSTSELIDTATADTLPGWDAAGMIKKIKYGDVSIAGRLINLAAGDLVASGTNAIYRPNATVYVCNLDPGVNLMLRAEPDSQSDILGKVQAGAQGTVRGRTADYRWVYVAMTVGDTEQLGYLPSSYLCAKPAVSLCALTSTATPEPASPVVTAVAPVGGSALDQGTPIPVVVVTVTPAPADAATTQP